MASQPRPVLTRRRYRRRAAEYKHATWETPRGVCSSNDYKHKRYSECIWSMKGCELTRVTMTRGPDPHTQRDILPLAERLCGKCPSESWIKLFIGRHTDSLKLSRPSGLDPKRAQAFNQPVVDGFFKLLKKVIDMHNIPPEKIYNMDEKGCRRGGGRKLTQMKYFVRRTNWVSYQKQSDCMELATIIDCVAWWKNHSPRIYLCREGVYQQLVSVWWKDSVSNVKFTVILPCASFLKVLQHQRTAGPMISSPSSGLRRASFPRQQTETNPESQSCWFWMGISRTRSFSFSYLYTSIILSYSHFPLTQRTSCSCSMLVFSVCSHVSGSSVARRLLRTRMWCHTRTRVWYKDIRN